MLTLVERNEHTPEINSDEIQRLRGLEHLQKSLLSIHGTNLSNFMETPSFLAKALSK